MARRRNGPRLGVFLNGRLVGHLTLESSGAVDFLYAPSWLAWQQTFAISLSLPLREDRHLGAPVLAVFDNLLPDNPSLRKRLAERVGAEGIDPVSLLAALGRDCVGALQFLPDGLEPGQVRTVEGTAISEADIADMLRNLVTNPLGMDRDRDFRISIAGVQEKTALLKHDNRWLLPRGTTATTHIFKPQIGQLPTGLDLSKSVENEYLCLKLTAAFGLPTAMAEMETFEDQRALVVERFDRIWTDDNRLIRVPQEDMCQALGVPWTRKYQSEGGPGIAEIDGLLGASDEPLRDRRNFLKANIVFWLLGATDGHAKNFSVRLAPRGGFQLTQLYDVISLQPCLDSKAMRHRDFRLAMAIGKAREYRISEIHRRHFIETANTTTLGLRRAETLIDELIEATPRAIGQVRAALPAAFPEEIAASIFQGVEQRAGQLARERT